MRYKSLSSLFGLITVLFLFLVSSCETTYSSGLLSTIKPGTPYTYVQTQIAPPQDSLTLQKWIYAPDTEILLHNETVYDFKLNKTLHPNKLRTDTTLASSKLVLKWNKIKIGFAKEEVENIVGSPLVKVPTTLYFYKAHQQFFVENGVVSVVNLNAHTNMEAFDRIRLNFNASSIHIINIALALIMFGIALDLRWQQFREVLAQPRSFLVGVLSQFFMLPFFSFILILIIQPTTSVAMGMLLVASCPGGNISNFMSALSRGNTALSISLTSFSTITTTFMTPLNFALWGGLYAGTSDVVIPIHIDSWQMSQTVLLILGLPVVLGILFQKFFPKIASHLRTPIKVFGILFFIGLIVGALSANFNVFRNYIHLIFFLVLGHNLLALATGFSLSHLFRLPNKDIRTVTIETGIQNSGLGLVLIFNPKLFDGVGGMAFVAAWWGIWHIISGLGLALFWNRRRFRTL